MRALVSGEPEPAAALAEALRERGAEVELVAGGADPAARAVAELARGLTELERLAADGGLDVAVAVGLGDAAIALALVAAKLGVPLITCQRSEDALGDAELAHAEWRILGELAEERLGMPGEGAGADAVAQRIVARVAAGEGAG
ncbi:MAG TPA: hypothetical protein VIL04_13985 [Solirubrobacterales bacterium]|jgi:hypothetical protein